MKRFLPHELSLRPRKNLSPIFFAMFLPHQTRRLHQFMRHRHPQTRSSRRSQAPQVSCLDSAVTVAHKFHQNQDRVVQILVALLHEGITLRCRHIPPFQCNSIQAISQPPMSQPEVVEITSHLHEIPSLHETGLYRKATNPEKLYTPIPRQMTLPAFSETASLLPTTLSRKPSHPRFRRKARVSRECSAVRRHDQAFCYFTQNLVECLDSFFYILILSFFFVRKGGVLLISGRRCIGCYPLMICTCI